MPELRQFANVVQLNETREQLLMHRDDSNVNVSNVVYIIITTTPIVLLLYIYWYIVIYDRILYNYAYLYRQVSVLTP